MVSGFEVLGLRVFYIRRAERHLRAEKAPKLHPEPAYLYELYSKLLTGDYAGDYVWDYYGGYSGRCLEFRLWLISTLNLMVYKPACLGRLIHSNLNG